MRTFFRILGRLITVIVGYIAASFAAGVTLVLAVTGWAGGFADAPLGALLTHAFYAGGALAAFIVILAFPPSAVLALVGEIFAIRNGFFYVFVGGLVAALGYVGASDFGRVGSLPPGATEELMAFIAAGLVAGAAYWLVAGRTAGLRPAEPEPPEPEVETPEPAPEAPEAPAEGPSEPPRD